MGALDKAIEAMESNGSDVRKVGIRVAYLRRDGWHTRTLLKVKSSHCIIESLIKLSKSKPSLVL